MNGTDARFVNTAPSGHLAPATLGVALSALSGAMLLLAFPPHNLWPLIWVGFVPMLVAQYRLLPLRMSSVAPAIALGGWLGMYFQQIFGLGRGAWYMQALPLIVAMLAYLIGMGDRRFHERTGYRWFVLHGVSAWIGLEMIRGFIPALGTWAFVGYPLWSQTWLLQPISIFGIYGLDTLIMMSNYVIALVMFGLFDRHWQCDHLRMMKACATRCWSAILVIFLVGWAALSLVLLSGPSKDAPTVRVAAIQPNLPRPAHLDGEISQEVRLNMLATQTRDAAAKGARIVVWPEMGLGFDPQVRYSQYLTALAAETGTFIVIGYVLETDQGFRNEAAVLTPSGDFLGVYGKAHPVVFFDEPKGVNAGAFPVFDTPIARLATIICFDLNFTDSSRNVARQSAQLIAVPSLDGPTLARIQYTQLVFRAIENRVAMVKSDSAWDSAIVDPYGRILAAVATPEGSKATVIAEVALGTTTPLYPRLGDWPGWLSLFGLVFFMVFIQMSAWRAGGK